MLKKRITYTNPFDGQEVAEEHYFHISKADLVEMEMGEHATKYRANDGEELTGMRAKIQRIIDSEDGKAIMDELKDIIRRAYGRKEGERFIKSKEIAEEFMQSEAFSELFFELCTNPASAADFINGIVPANLEQMAAEAAAQVAATQGPTSAGDTMRKEVLEGTGTATEAATPSTTVSQDEARRIAVAEGHPSDFAAQAPPTAPTSPAVHTAPTPTAPPSESPAEQRAKATPEAPYFLTSAEVAELDSEDFKSGIATGRYKLS